MIKEKVWGAMRDPYRDQVRRLHDKNTVQSDETTYDNIGRIFCLHHPF
jgi:hypothetical protein